MEEHVGPAAGVCEDLAIVARTKELGVVALCLQQRLAAGFRQLSSSPVDEHAVEGP